MKTLLFSLLILLIAGCSPDVTLLNEQNPHFQKAVQYRDQGEYRKAAAEFEACLMYSPRSYQAHLQLAMLYEDHLHDLPRSIVHYESYLDLVQDPAQREPVKLFLVRAEKAYYEELRAKYGPAEPKPAVQPSELKPPPAPPAPGPAAGAASAPAKPIVAAPAAPAKPAPVAPTAKPAPAASTAKPAYEMYTVQKGDTLSKIARKFYGDSERWRDIYELNKDKLKSADQLKIGMELQLPPRPVQK